MIVRVNEELTQLDQQAVNEELALLTAALKFKQMTTFHSVLNISSE